LLREHLERVAPVCPSCRVAGREPAPLALGSVARAHEEDVLEGVLLCTERVCQREYPIIDGIPIVVADIESWAAHQLGAVLRRDDLSPFTESLLGDAAGPSSDFHRERSNLSAYGSSHWGQGGGGYAELVRRAFELLSAPVAGLWLDLGSSVGRGTLELARAGAELAIGVDLSFSMLRVAERVRREGRAVFPQRRHGVVFDRLERPVEDVPARRMTFWCCDATVLPLAAGRAQGALLLNLLDCVPRPLNLLAEAGRVLEPGAAALFSSPYDWSPQATPLEQWIGGHSQRSVGGGSSVAELRRVLSPTCEAGVDTGLVIVAERDPVAWRIPTSERSTMEYAVHLARLQRKP
jgi:SAM-dependent methyltransferase